MPETEFLTEVGTRIRKIRISKKITETKLALLCDMDLSSMSRIETGKTNITLITLQKISTALNVPVAHLLRDEEPAALKPEAVTNKSF